MHSEEIKSGSGSRILATHIQQALAPNAQVEQNVRIRGIHSGVDRQIDIAVRTRAGQFDLLVVIDCKDYQIKVDVKDVEAFIGLAKDVGANKGALVSSMGYTPAAKTIASNAGLSLFTLVDAESEDWPAFVSMSVLIDMRAIESMSYEISSYELTRLPSDNLQCHPVFRPDGRRIGRLQDLVVDRWHTGKIPKDPGQYRDIYLSDGGICFEEDSRLAKVELRASVHVTKTLYFGHVPLADTQGFWDDLSGGYLTKAMTTDRINFEQVIQEWQVVESEEALAVKPTMKLEVATHLTTEADLIADLEKAK